MNTLSYRRGPGLAALIALPLAAALALAPTAARAQVSSIGKGLMTLELGRGSMPVGAIATQVADPGTDVPHSTASATAFRLLAGYHFAEYLSVEVGITHVGFMKSSAVYAGTDVLRAQTTLQVIEGDLVGHWPFARNARVDLSLGIAETGLHTTLATQNGTALPTGETGEQKVRRLGPTAGLDLEYRLTDTTSVLIGYHAYAHVGSPVLRDSASGTASTLFAGAHFEF